MSKSGSDIVITPGEPAGVGPELLVRLAQRDRDSRWVAVADAGLLERAAARVGVPIAIDDRVDDPASCAGALTVQHVPLRVPECPGRLDVANAEYVLETLRRAGEACLSGARDALVTGPVQKSVLNDAGIPFSGHTEYFCELSGVPDVLMLLVAGSLRVALATTHLPLKAVPEVITPALLERRITLLLEGLKRQFGLATPRVLVAGLNPHAGEGGHMGSEEVEVITPVCEAFRARGERVVGPLPADTLFTPRMLQDADAVLAMYHDQGLPVLKYVGFGHAVNVTLGLPFVRTSVDHGTALDIAGSGRADPGSFDAALGLAARLAALRSAPA